MLLHAINLACSQTDPWSSTASAMSWSFSRGIKALIGLICFKCGHAQTERAIPSAAKDSTWQTAWGQGLWHSPRIRARGCRCPVWQQALSESDIVSLLLSIWSSCRLCIALTVCSTAAQQSHSNTCRCAMDLPSLDSAFDKAHLRLSILFSS